MTAVVSSPMPMAHPWHANVTRSLRRPIRANTLFQSPAMDATIALEDVDRRWKHRAGWPRLCNLPLETEVLWCDRPDLAIEGNWNELSSRVDEILARHQIEVRTGLTRAVRTQERFAHELPSKDLRIIVDCIYNPDREKDNPDSWALAVIEIHQAIREIIDHPRDVGVEIYDMEYEDSIRFTDLPPSFTEFEQNWEDGENYEQQILAEFENRPQLWQVMMPIGLEAKNEHGTHHTCAVWFDAIDTDDSSWPEIEKKLALILPADVSVEIWQAAGDLCESSNVDKILQTDDFIWPPLPGASIGPTSELSSGTLGGYVRVQEPKTDKLDKSGFRDRIYAITNAHVALGGQLPKKSQEIRRDRNSIQQRIQMMSPSLQDCEKYIKKHQSSIALCERLLSKRENELALLQQSNDVLGIERVHRQITDMKAKINALKERGAMAQKDYTMGTVQSLARGTRNPNDKPEFQGRLAMDIALIDASGIIASPEDVLYPENKNDRHSWVYSNKTCHSWHADGLVSKGHAGRNVEVVGFVGRTSGFSMGIVNGVKVDIDMNLRNSDGTKQFLSAYAVRPVSSQSAYSQSGDSGSFVFTASFFEDGDYQNRLTTNDDELVVLGIHFGGSPRARLGYFIPFDEVVKEIEALTGGRVMWPTKLG